MIVLKKLPVQSSSTIDKFQGKEIYDGVFPLPFGPKLSETSFYGKINEKNEPIILGNEQYLSRINENVRCLDFVKNAFQDLQQYIKSAISLRRIRNDSFLFSGLVVKKGYEDVQRFYLDFLSRILATIKKKSSHPKEFINQAMNEIIESSRFFPASLSSYILTNKNSGRISGLILEVSEESYEDNRMKIQKYLNDPNFLFYREACQQFGFKIDIDIPWQLKADISSPAMEKYLNGVNVFDKYFKKAWYYDVEAFQAAIYGVYNEFLGQKRVFSKDDEEFSWWLENYVKIKINEYKKTWNSSQIKNFSIRTSQLQFLLDKEKIFDYISYQLLSTN